MVRALTRFRAPQPEACSVPLGPPSCRSPADKQMANLECNAVSAVQITHLLLSRMRAKKLRGCFVFTSSGAAAQRSCLRCRAATHLCFLLSMPGSCTRKLCQMLTDMHGCRAGAWASKHTCSSSACAYVRAPSAAAAWAHSPCRFNPSPFSPAPALRRVFPAPVLLLPPAAAAMIPNPFSVLYASTKSFLSGEHASSCMLACWQCCFQRAWATRAGSLCRAVRDASRQRMSVAPGTCHPQQLPSVPVLFSACPALSWPYSTPWNPPLPCYSLVCSLWRLPGCRGAAIRHRRAGVPPLPSGHPLLRQGAPQRDACAPGCQIAPQGSGCGTSRSARAACRWAILALVGAAAVLGLRSPLPIGFCPCSFCPSPPPPPFRHTSWTPWSSSRSLLSSRTSCPTPVRRRQGAGRLGRGGGGPRQGRGPPRRQAVYSWPLQNAGRGHA